MHSILSAATLVLSTSFGQIVINEDDISLVRAQNNKKSMPVSVWTYRNDGPTTTDFVGALSSSVLKIKGVTGGGGKQLRWTFPGDWDGDGIDEIIAVREHVKKKDRRMDIEVRRAPKKIFDNINKVLARSKKADFGVGTGEGKIVAAGAMDHDGDGIDEAVIVREHVWGARFLEIRNLPPSKKGKMGGPIASDIEFGGQAGLDEIISIWGTDLSGDGKDEIALLTRNASGVDTLNVYAAPATLFADTGLPVTSYPNATPQGGFVNVFASRIFLKENAPGPAAGAEYVVFGQIHPDTLQQRVRVHARPAIVGAALPVPIVADTTPGFDSADFRIVSVFGARKNPPPPPPPPPSINGSYTITFNVEDLQGGQVNVGPFPGVTAAVSTDGGGNFFWNVTIPGTPLLASPVNGPIADGAFIDIPPPAAPPPITYYTFNVPSASGPATAGDLITWTGMSVAITNGTPLLIAGTDGFCDPQVAPPNPITCGRLTSPDGQTVKAYVRGITFTKQ